MINEFVTVHRIRYDDALQGPLLGEDLLCLGPEPVFLDPLAKLPSSVNKPLRWIHSNQASKETCAERFNILGITLRSVRLEFGPNKGNLVPSCGLNLSAPRRYAMPSSPI